MAPFFQTLIENPVARAELSHQQRTVTNQRWRRFPAIFGLGLGVALISNGSLLVVPQLAGLIQMLPRDLDSLLHGWFGTVTIMLGALIMIHHLAFSTAALQLGSTTIAREKQGGTWENLLLTGVDARRIVYGKWSATMRTLWQVYRPLLFLRFGVALWMGASGSIARVTPFAVTPSLESIFLIGIVTAVFPLFYAGFTVALGVLASLLVTSETAAHRIGSLLLIGTIVVSLSLIVLSFTLSFSNVEPGLVSLIPALFVTPLDGGMLALIGMIANNGPASFYYLFGLILCIAVYAALTWMALRGAQALAVHQHALPPTR